jgi:hypothetical protein
LGVCKALLEGFDLITGMIGSDDRPKGGWIGGGIEEAEFVNGEESRSIVLFPVPGGSDGVCGTEWIVFVVTWGMRAIGSEWRSKFRQPASVTLHLDFESIIRLLSIGLLSLQTSDSFASLLGLELIQGCLDLLVLRLGLVSTFAAGG